jgi:hypothetical protein
LKAKEIYSIKITFLPEAVNRVIKINKIDLNAFYFSYKPSYPWSEEIVSIFDYFLDITNESVF